MKSVPLRARPHVVAGSLIAAVGAVLMTTGAASSGLAAATPASQLPHIATAGVVHNRCQRSTIDVPACGVLWGLYTPKMPARPRWVAHYGVIQKSIGRRFDLIKNYVDWQHGVTFPDASYRKMSENGRRTLYFSWNAINYYTRAKVSYESIADGSWDKSVILPEARALKHYHHRIFMDFSHEFDNHAQAGRGTPAQYVAAYRHIHQVFQEAGVRNVIWAWVSTGYLGHAAYIKASYPGSSYVDWVGYDPYNFAECHSERWRTPYQTFQPFYHWVSHQKGMEHKPIILAEYASAPGSKIGAWYASVASALKHLPRIKAVIQWDSHDSNCDFRLTSSTAALAGFGTSSNARYITGPQT